VGFKIGTGLYTGQIPLDSNKTFHQEYEDMISLAKLTEEVGLDAAWVSEHHFSADGYLPSLLAMLAAFAVATERIELGTGVILAPFHDPIRMAEDFAVVDQISTGRTIAGFGIAWRDEEFREFNIPVKSRVGRTKELVEILRLAWNEDRFDYNGKHFTYSGVSVTPKPARVPPLLVGGFVDDAIKRAGRIGDGYISSRAAPERLKQAFEMAAEERKKAGHEGPPIVGLLQNVFVTNDPDGDWDMVYRGIGHQLGVYTGWRVGTDVPGTPLKVMPPTEDEVRQSTAYGTPDQVVEFLTPLAKLLGAYPESHIVLRFYYPGMPAEAAAASIELFAKEVAPRLREAAGS
jgi:alkanesulfonate monooxygenase SsuD/methylene tetrahydromethanopterin reductase-like flavin-dependent oxidoreductase (luciferase family)